MHVVVDAAEPGRLARFWAAALGWEIAMDELADPEGGEFCVLSPRGSPP